MLEFPTEQKAGACVKDHKECELGGVSVKIEKYSTKVAQWEKEKPKNGKFEMVNYLVLNVTLINNRL